jgi:transcriptional regulator with XRE-family HTH domain
MARTLGSELRNLRRMRGLSLKAVADPAGVSAPYLQKLERDGVDSPSPHRLHALARVLGVEYADLLLLAGYPLPEASSGDVPPGRRPSRSRAGALTSAKGSLLRRAFQSEDQVSDDELEQLARYLAFLREQSGTR